MAYHSARTPLAHEHEMNMRRAKYASATKSKTSWLEKQLKIREQFEREYYNGPQ